MTKQEQFLDVVDRDEAERRFTAALRLEPLGAERVGLADCLGRVLAHDVISHHDVPSFDRSNFDGYAVQGADTYGATEERPRRLLASGETIIPGLIPADVLTSGQAIGIVTGAMLPRGADAVVMIEDTDEDLPHVLVRRAVNPGSGVTFAGTDIARGETILWRGELLTSRETGVVAATGEDSLHVFKRPRVGIISTGDEIVPPGSAIRAGQVFDSNARILADAVTEQGGVPDVRGIVSDNKAQLRTILIEALSTCDIILLSGGTSKGTGDLSYQVVHELTRPGIVAHGVALKPGKPVCLASHHGKPVAVLPGFPTSAIFTFHEFIAPVIRQLAGIPRRAARTLPSARMAVPVRSQIGRTEYFLVSLVAPRSDAHTSEPLWAYPMGKGSGSVTTFSRADGFVTILRHEELVAAGQSVDVHLLSLNVPVADLVIIGSHCVGLDYLLGLLQQQKFHTKFMAVGSTAGLAAACHGQCDLAGIHLLDPATGVYNRPFVTEDLAFLPGYRRLQGVVHRMHDSRFEGKQAAAAVRAVKDDTTCLMVNRNQGSGTRLLIDQLLEGSQPRGYAVQPRNHNAVAAAVAQNRADWGVAVEHVAHQAGLGFLPLTEEHYDFVSPRDRADSPAIRTLRNLLKDPHVQAQLEQLGCRVTGAE